MKALVPAFDRDHLSGGFLKGVALVRRSSHAHLNRRYYDFLNFTGGGGPSFYARFHVHLSLDFLSRYYKPKYEGDRQRQQLQTPILDEDATQPAPGPPRRIDGWFVFTKRHKVNRLNRSNLFGSPFGFRGAHVTSRCRVAAFDCLEDRGSQTDRIKRPLNSSGPHKRYQAGLFRNDNCDCVRIFGDSQSRAMSRAEVL